jgi:gamma-glutamyltranspeptidase / glutathione hydrolase
MDGSFARRSGGRSAAASPLALEAQNGMVVSSQQLASEAGAEILKAGGNAIDAAVAVGYAEAVVNPCCGNLGGGGFIVMHLADGRDRFIGDWGSRCLRKTPTFYAKP